MTTQHAATSQKAVPKPTASKPVQLKNIKTLKTDTIRRARGIPRCDAGKPSEPAAVKPVQKTKAIKITRPGMKSPQKVGQTRKANGKKK